MLPILQRQRHTLTHCLQTGKVDDSVVGRRSVGEDESFDLWLVAQVDLDELDGAVGDLLNATQAFDVGVGETVTRQANR